MRKNVLGELVIEPIDYYQFLSEQLKREKIYSIKPNNHVHGVDTDFDDSPGLYFVYKVHKSKTYLLYIGYTGHSVRARLGRYFAAAKNKQRVDENHAAGELHRQIFYEDFDEMYIKIIDINFKNLPNGIQPTHLEDMMIEQLQPLFNNSGLNLEKNYKVDITRKIIHDVKFIQK